MGMAVLKLTAKELLRTNFTTQGKFLSESLGARCQVLSGNTAARGNKEKLRLCWPQAVAGSGRAGDGWTSPGVNKDVQKGNQAQGVTSSPHIPGRAEAVRV